MVERPTLLVAHAEKQSDLRSGLGPIRAATLTDQCHDRMKSAIINLEFRPKALLSEHQLAEQLGISKSPVREALARLVGEGFVVAEGGRKCRVADLDAQTIRDFYKVRMHLEPASLLEVAPTLVNEDFERLQMFIEEDRESLRTGNLPRVVSASNDFHILLIERSGNRHLIRIARHLFDQANRVRAAIQLAEQDADHQDLSLRGLESHQAILDALIAREPERAAALLRRDIEVFLEAATSPAMQKAFEQLSAVP